jgi:hypothetical protein
MRELSLMYAEGIISKGLWPHSQGICHNQAFLQGYYTNNAYSNNPRNLDYVKINTANTITDISPTTLQAVSTNMFHRAQLCMQHAVHTFINYCSTMHTQANTLPE